MEKGKLLGSVGIILMLVFMMVPTGIASAATGSWNLGLNTGNSTYEQSAGMLNAMRFQADLSPLLEQKTNLTHPAADPAAAVAGGTLYSFGGYGTSDTNYLNYTQEYDPVTDTWVQKAAMPTARWGAAAATLGSKIYVFGGTASGGSPSNKAEGFNVAGNSWETKTNLPSAYANGIMAVTAGSYIYIFYGTDTLQFDPTGNGGAGSYTVKASSPAWKKWGTCAYVNVGGEDRIYIIGGSNSTTVFQNSNYYYIPGTNTWSSAQAAAPYAAHGVTRDNPVYNAKIYYGFGWTGYELFHKSLYSYDAASNTWSAPLAQGVTPRDGVGCGVIGNRLYIAGGRNVGTNPYGLSNTESYFLDSISSYEGTLNELDILFDDATPNGNVRLGVYSDNNGKPGNLLLDAGSTAVANGWVSKNGLSLNVNNGVYCWLAFNMDSSNSVKYQSGQPAGSHYWATSAYGALPAQFSSVGTGSNSSQYVMRATIMICGNSAPVAVNDAYSVNEDTTLNVAAPGVLTNDTDADGNPLTAVKVTDPAHGTLTLNSNGSFTYTPAASYIGTDSFTYRANDGQANSNTATVTITITAVNDAPVAVNDAYTTGEDTALTRTAPGVLTNDTDADGNPLTAVKVTDPAHGTLTLNSNGSFTYTPAANYSGTDSFTYRANDGQANSNTATVTITITAVNDAPVAVNDAYTTSEDTALTRTAPGVLANDTDADGNALTAVKVTDPAHGKLTLNGNGSFTYTPAANYSGTDSFTYRANDGQANSNTATATITISGPVTATFGLDGGNSTYNESANVIDAMRFQNAAGTGMLTKLELLFDDTTPVGKVRLGVYADNSGAPGSLLLDAGEVTVSNGWVSITDLNLSVIQNTYYWLAFDLQSANGVRYQTGRPSKSHYWGNYTYGAFPAQYTLTGMGSNSNQYIMLATVVIPGP